MFSSIPRRPGPVPDSQEASAVSDTTVGLCRITIRAPESVFELGIPVDVPLVELMPVLLDYAGDGLDELALEHGGWVLQRLGAPPLDGELTARALELRDGDTLHLRPRNETLPEAAFDDLGSPCAPGAGWWTDTADSHGARRAAVSCGRGRCAAAG